ncbi:zf-HC2 domain-containing protein, partial [Streptomyces boncukensis]|nr:zf-HC2 domain-containing protein [Streptomyces boncukensis]
MTWRDGHADGTGPTGDSGPTGGSGPAGHTAHTAHTDVGAYALGVLDSAAAERFEEHLAECDRCAVELESLTGLAPLLAEHAVAGPSPEPSGGLLERLFAQAADERRRARRTQRVWLAMAVCVVVVGGPLALFAVLNADFGGGGG